MKNNGDLDIFSRQFCKSCSPSCCFATAVATATCDPSIDALVACIVLVDVDLPCLLVMRKPKNHDPVGQSLRS